MTQRIEKAMTDWFHAILDHLFIYPLNDEFVEINSFIINKLEVNENDTSKAKIVASILNFLLNKDFIKWEDKKDDPNMLPFGIPSSVNYDNDFHKKYGTSYALKGHVILAKLTLDGYNYINNKNLSRQQHTSIISTNEFQKTFGTKSLWLAVISSVFIFITIIQSALDRTPERMQDIEKQLKNTTLSLDSIRISLESIDSSISLKTDSPFVNQ